MAEKDPILEKARKDAVVPEVTPEVTPRVVGHDNSQSFNQGKHVTERQ